MARGIETLIGIEGYWYLATPYTKWWAGRDDAAQEACLIAGGLIKRGVPVYSPIAHCHVIGLACEMDMGDAEMWLTAERPMADRAHGILIAKLIGWQHSHGVTKEREWFDYAGKPAWLLDPTKWTIESLE